MPNAGLLESESFQLSYNVNFIALPCVLVNFTFEIWCISKLDFEETMTELWFKRNIK